MKGFYNVTTKIKEFLEAHNDINVVTMERLQEGDLNKQTIFPLANIIVGDAVFNDNVITFDITVACMDIEDDTKENKKDQPEPFFGATNKQDILNTMLAVVNALSQSLKKGSLNTDLFQINGIPTASPFEEDFENVLTGWVIDFTVDIPNTEISICP
ncbi:MAG: hypothetical protein JKY54_17720 [Flavobacteriales bacterium]|nr:hypothetical protein [Flavobacteriales bacterium]